MSHEFCFNAVKQALLSDMSCAGLCFAIAGLFRNAVIASSIEAFVLLIEPYLGDLYVLTLSCAGSGFVGEPDIRTSTLPCDLISQNFTHIVCSVGDAGFEVRLGFTVSFGGTLITPEYFSTLPSI